MKRMLLEHEKFAIRWVAARLPVEQQESLMEDFVGATVVDTTPDNSAIVFGLDSYQRPNKSGQRSFGIKGKLFDSDGALLSFDLYADENYRLFILELIRWDGKEINSPNWNLLEQVHTDAP